MARTKTTFSMCMNTELLTRIDEVAEKNGLSRSAVIEIMLRALESEKDGFKVVGK